MNTRDFMDSRSPPGERMKNANHFLTITDNWNNRTGMRVGDFVVWPDGELRRVSDVGLYGCQTFLVGNHGGFYISPEALVSFSGKLQPHNLAEFFQPTEDIRSGSFWTFYANRKTGGNGVFIELPCRVFKLAPFKRTLMEANQHPRALLSASMWGAESPHLLRCVEEIMNPPVISDPERN